MLVRKSLKRICSEDYFLCRSLSIRAKAYLFYAEDYSSPQRLEQTQKIYAYANNAYAYVKDHTTSRKDIKTTLFKLHFIIKFYKIS